ncbi:hypothetical protein FGIG_01400 [Fasciola gigantica]|uniref:Rho-GAP domain-containing protein n=1 Tax=Fasciola gigantica TaxID=46835 RepID=A0A504YXX9_FASGI|nr:hypothetical protein FGIG_01400 [Fasciola gigantica]
MIIPQELENSKSTVESGELRTNPCFESLNNRCLLIGPNGVDELKILTPDVTKVITAVLTTQYSKHTDNIAERWKTKLNNCPEGWDLLDREEHDALVISKLLFDWLAHLKSPVIRAQDFHTIDITTTSGVIEAMEPLETAVACVFILTARFMVGLGARSDIVMMALIKRFVYAFCQTDQKFEAGVQLIASMPCIPRVSPISHDCSNAAVKLMSVLIDFIRAKQYLS